MRAILDGGRLRSGDAAAQPGQITGVVVDATGGVLPGATVTLSGGPSGPQQVQTDARGWFTFTGLSPGVYTVSVYLNGFGEAAVHDVAVAGEPVALLPLTLPLAAFDDVAVVTATRIEEPLQQVPLSISAVTGADLERRAIGNLTELSRWTPGLTVVDQGARGSNVLIVRGLHTDALTGVGVPTASRTASRFWSCQPFSDPLRPGLVVVLLSKCGSIDVSSQA